MDGKLYTVSLFSVFLISRYYNFGRSGGASAFAGGCGWLATRELATSRGPSSRAMFRQ